jgi:hypothetical protein
MGYCTVDEVTTAFPQFTRNAQGSIQDATIQSWIDDAASRIDAALAARGVHRELLVGQEQVDFLRSTNRSAGICDLALALQETSTLQPGESALADLHCKRFEDTLKAILDGKYDNLLRPVDATVGLVGRGVDGYAGAEAPTQVPLNDAWNRAFWKHQDF